MKYTITIEIESAENENRNFINSLFDEVKSEKKQLINCHKINEATTKVHRQILEDTIVELNNDLRTLNVKFHSLTYNDHSTNKYKGSKAIITFSNGWSYKLYCSQNLSSNVEGIKFCTYIDKPTFKIERSGYSCYSAIYDKNPRNVKKEDILKFMQRDIKEHISKI